MCPTMQVADKVRPGLLLGFLTVAPDGSAAGTLPLPDTLIALHSAEGETLLFGAEARADYLPLSLHFVTQATPAYCGPATMAMLLNALGVPRPSSDETLGLGMFDQDNVLDDRTDTVIPRAKVAEKGMSLKDFGASLAAHNLDVQVTFAEHSSLEEFRRIAVAELGEPSRFVAVNYLRSAVGQETGGHISPLAAYDADTDRLLVLDVTRYKYPPVWIEAAALFDAMNTRAGKNTRGFVVVGR
jgi:hypothetical protein